MKREKLFYGTAIAVLVAALILGLWYKQPKTIREITGVAEPETVTVIIQQRNVMLADIDLRKLTLSAGDEGFDALMAQLDGLEFRRPPTNLLRMALPFLGDADSSEKDLDEGDFYRMDVTFSSSDWEGPTAPSYVSFWVDQWSYRDYEHDLTLPLAVVDGKETGQALCAQLWEISQPADS